MNSSCINKKLKQRIFVDCPMLKKKIKNKNTIFTPECDTEKVG